jgi:MFS family permease
VFEVRLVQAGFGVSSLGDFLAIAALTIRVHDTTGSPWAVGGLVLAGLLPLIVMGPPAGMLVDRMDPVRLLRVTLAVQAGIAAALAFVSGYAWTLALVFALGTGTAIGQAALLGLLPALLRRAGSSRSALSRVNGGLEACRSVGVCLGPPVGGIITTTWNAAGALLVDALSFAVLCAALFVVAAGRASDSTDGTQNTGDTCSGRMLDGVAHIARDPLLRVALGVLSVATMFLAGVNMGEVFFAKDTLHAGDLGYGAMAGAWGLGMIAGAIATGHGTSGRDPVTVLAGGCLAAGIAVALPALVPYIGVGVACWFAAGCTNGAYQVAMRTLIHLRTPSGLHGRVFAAQYGAYTTAKLGALMITGFLMARLSPRGAILAIGIGTAVTGACGLLARIRTGAGHPSTATIPLPSAAPANANRTSDRTAKPTHLDYNEETTPT